MLRGLCSVCAAVSLTLDRNRNRGAALLCGTARKEIGQLLRKLKAAFCVGLAVHLSKLDRLNVKSSELHRDVGIRSALPKDS